MILYEKEINNKLFCLVKNSIIEEKVEAIVNPANENLLHGGGVAGLISDAGGPVIQRESFEKAPVLTGQSVYSSAGNLPFKYIIHTVGPIWQGGRSGESELLKSAIVSALKLADELSLSSLSMPAVSTGIFGYPIASAIKTIVTAIFNFLCHDSTLKTVHLCVFSEERAREIKEIILQI